MIFAIDPGNVQSAYVILDDELKPIEFAKVDNEKLLEILKRSRIENWEVRHYVIEKIASYGMSVGQTIFDTCIWTGRFVEVVGGCMEYIYRKDEKMNLCGTMKAKDTNIRQALIDRFGVVGTKKDKGFFYGFKADVWAAMAVGVTYHDMYLKN